MRLRTWRVAVAATAALVVGGSATALAARDGAAAARGSDPVTVTFWNGFTGPDRPAVEGLVKQFNAAHPDMQVKMSIMPWDVFFQKLLPSYASNKGPVIAAMDSVQLPRFATKGVFTPLDDLFKNGGLDSSKLVKSAFNAGKWDGKQYGVPMNFTTLLLYWNKGMFKAAGLNPNKPPTTWAQWASYAQKLTKDKNGDGKPEQYGLALADHETIPMWPILIWGGGGDVVSPDGKTAKLSDPKTVKAVQFWSNLILNKKISPVGLGGADADKLFQSKKAAMEVVGPWMTTGFKQAGIDFGLAMVPKGPSSQVTLGTSVQFAVSSRASDDEKNAAYEFIKFWESPKSQTYWAVHSGFPPTRTDVKASALSGNAWVAQFGKYSKQSRFYLTGVEDYQQVNDNTFVPAIQKILNKKGSPSSILSSANKQVDSALGG